MHRSQSIFEVVSGDRRFAFTKRVGAKIAILGLAALFGQSVFASSTSLSPQIQDAATTAEAVDQTAQLIGVKKEVSDLRTYVQKNDTADRWRILYLHQYVSERITAASLQVDATIAQIDNEIARAQEVGSYLSDRRDRAVTRANLFGILIGGGLGAVSSGLQLSSQLDKPAASVGIGAGTLSAGFGLAGIHAQRGESAKFDFDSNMLAEFFDRPILADSHYPSTVLAFLDQIPLRHSGGLTRRQDLIDTWIRVRRIDSLDSKDKIARLTCQPSDQMKLTIDDLGDRAAMLQDVRARISFLKRDLGTLLASLPAVVNYSEDNP